MPNGIPRKGEVLTQISYFWFGQTEAFQPNHLLSRAGDPLPASLQPYAGQLARRSMIVKKAKPLAIECVVRGYLAGSGWKEYRDQQTVCGIKLPAGLKESSELPEPIFTPATKAESGHDENISFEQAARIVGGGHRRASAGGQPEGSTASPAITPASAGIIIADTKFEFGLLDGKLILIDEVLTPDSSRFWPADQYQPGKGQPSFDKQFVRDYLETLDWNKTPPAPAAAGGRGRQDAGQVSGGLRAVDRARSCDERANPGRRLPPIPPPRARAGGAHAANLRRAAEQIRRLGGRAGPDGLESGRTAAPDVVPASTSASGRWPTSPRNHRAGSAAKAFIWRSPPCAPSTGLPKRRSCCRPTSPRTSRCRGAGSACPKPSPARKSRSCWRRRRPRRRRTCATRRCWSWPTPRACAWPNCAALRLEQLHLEAGFINVIGKGNKERVVPARAQGRGGPEALP